MSYLSLLVEVENLQHFNWKLWKLGRSLKTSHFMQQWAKTLIEPKFVWIKIYFVGPRFAVRLSGEFRHKYHCQFLSVFIICINLQFSKLKLAGASAMTRSSTWFTFICILKIVSAGIRFSLLRLSTIRKCPPLHRSDHRELRTLFKYFPEVLAQIGPQGAKLGWCVVVCSQTLLKVIAQMELCFSLYDLVNICSIKYIQFKASGPGMDEDLVFYLSYLIWGCC